MIKGLDALKNIRDICYGMTNVFDEYLDIIEKELKELKERREMMRRFNEACVPMILDNETEQKLKALEIIKKFVRVSDNGMYFRHYNLSGHITKEEYELLKEELL